MERRNGAVQVCRGRMNNAEPRVQAKTRIEILEERWTFAPNKLSQTLKVQEVVIGGSVTPATPPPSAYSVCGKQEDTEKVKSI